MVNHGRLIKWVLEDFPEVITGRSMIREANNLFQVIPEDERTILDKNRATKFHHTVAHMTFFTSRSSK